MVPKQDRALENAVRRVARAPSDEEAWRAFFTRAWPFVFGIAYDLLDGRRTAAEDVAQEVFLRFLRYRGHEKVRQPGRLRAYLRRMTRNVILDRHTREASRPEESSLDGDATAPTLQAAGESRFEIRDSLDHAFGVLAENDRDLLLCLASGFTVREIAERQGITYQNAAVRIHRLRNRLRALAPLADRRSLDADP